MSEARIERLLIAHPDAATRQAVEAMVRGTARRPVAARYAASPAEALQAARDHDPHIVFLDLERDRALVLAVARELRRPDRLIVGLFDPLVQDQASEAELLRQAVRSGVGDFVPVPVSEAEIAAVMAAAPEARQGQREGWTVAFLSAQGGVGTSTLAVNTALALAEAQIEVTLVDGHLQFGRVAAYLGSEAVVDIADALHELARGAAPGLPGVGAGGMLRALASPADPRAAEAISPDEVGRLLIELRRRSAVVIADTAPTLDLVTLAILDLAELIYVVTEGQAASVAATSRLLGMLADLGFAPERLRIVLDRDQSGNDRFAANAVADMLGRPVDHRVPFLQPVSVAGHRGVPALHERHCGPFAEAVEEIAAEVRQRLGLLAATAARR